jgi:hypothetical protein
MGRFAIKRKTDVCRTAAGRRFKRYKRETERKQREAEVTESQVMKEINGAWMAWIDVPRRKGILSSEFMPRLREGLRFDSQEIKAFMAYLEGFQHMADFPGKAGMFLSHLIREAQGAVFLIDTPHLDCPLHSIGGQDRKRIEVMGAAGDFFGNVMRGGSVVVHGDAGSAVGHWTKGGSISVLGNAGDFVGLQMSSGEISVQGNAGSSTGHAMRGGKITIHGDSGEYVGHEMTGGEIHVVGDMGSVGDAKAGKIFHKGKSVFDK